MSTNAMLLEPTLSSDFLSLEDQYDSDQVTKAAGHPGREDLRLLEVGVTAFPKASRGIPPVVSRIFDSRQTVDDGGAYKLDKGKFELFIGVENVAHIWIPDNTVFSCCFRK